MLSEVSGLLHSLQVIISPENFNDTTCNDVLGLPEPSWTYLQVSAVCTNISRVLSMYGGFCFFVFEHYSFIVSVNVMQR